MSMYKALTQRQRNAVDGVVDKLCQLINDSDPRERVYGWNEEELKEAVAELAMAIIARV